MTKEELEKATGQELIEQRDYCGVDGYYGDYLDNVNAEMLKRFNCLKELEKENAELKEEWQEQVQKANDEGYARTLQTVQLSKAKELLNEFMRISKASDEDFEHDYSELIAETEQFIKNSEVKK